MTEDFRHLTPSMEVRGWLVRMGLDAERPLYVVPDAEHPGGWMYLIPDYSPGVSADDALRDLTAMWTDDRQALGYPLRFVSLPPRAIPAGAQRAAVWEAAAWQAVDAAVRRQQE